MWQSFSRHTFEYLILVLLGAVFILAFILVGHNTPARIGLSLSVSSIYVIWAIIHHWLDHDLTVKIILEYACFAALAALILIGLAIQS
ncbi:hypothetical protein HY388_02560 [Candidatus Daviesbacteria bacterium]|nr:hypothetical protein [Candidatus Daviesbacteria bacterium]